ncbi:MAG: hypothetical protein A2700_01350 [Candidatus Blackburnbacteria bacterium RIFCSPHIGHO2_01_FULL_44_64]|uniref:Phosphoglucosamine mutase n=1 Tax=Candidatus Blackburnbacteria bacterium RIFCSPHIGHO2_02_FULL_44_20 TaxID=1797516 RepID=A0A1G1V6M3_9BACT|nr:MAG: hypothetical protein A2700_01350 [Candidatus Blackburnbacteria bacterium RIFCSPHIGHO2_01_FULL_44_64]OGY10727.1 MAG: hypothetical protein A3E16_01885 [Candidatus Blackburnbacteria bacterium RIFCSPHIGHO2_12_FULL_44_25]OGY11029.1 MAG: hypothetical protein A3D26_03895 [Candidatus Blackburnbacteria bacterium RIFCSPHIGHO2_02_FULL_44_20]OGY15223.1 MAG: hypothetical protein A3A62_02645 [Candidatus Blackburnbacteria bacterium RIFCSPLOWO2_01_FULL_44_43]OGY15858.1 MAG: hypothetical protein A3H88_0
MNLPNSIFHSYDIRGQYGKELTDTVALLLGKALGTFVLCNTPTHQKPTIGIGHDKRPSGETLKDSFAKGVTSTGCNVVDLGIVTTPMINFYEYTGRAMATGVAAGISITASHIKGNYNGFKISFNKKPFGKNEYQELRKIIEIGKFEKGQGKTKKESIKEEYLKHIYSQVDVKRNEIKQISKSLEFSQDPDGDRLIVKGVEPDLLNAIFAASILEKNPGTKIVLNVASSLSVIEYIEKHRGKVLLSKVGYPNVMALMGKSGALFGGEVSGHFYFKDRHFGYSDGLYSAARLCEIITKKDVSLAQLIKQIPHILNIQIRAKVPNEADAQTVLSDITKNMHAKFKDTEFLEIDGVRVNFPDKSWFLIRASGTENIITFRAEAKTKKRLSQLTNYAKRAFGKHKLQLK